MVNVPTEVIVGCAAVVTVPAVVAVLALPVSGPAKAVAVSVAVAELKVKPELLLGEIDPVAAVENIGKQVVSVVSSATVTVPPAADKSVSLPASSVNCRVDGVPVFTQR
jgi:hypothetical protein